MTPADLLAQYRKIAEDEIAVQAKAFRSLSASDQRELLFFMCAHLTAGQHHVVAAVAALSHEPVPGQLPSLDELLKRRPKQ